MSERIAMQIDWPDFQVYIGTVLNKDGAQIRMAVTYKGEQREKLMSCAEFARITGFDEARSLMGEIPKTKQRKNRRKPS